MDYGLWTMDLVKKNLNCLVEQPVLDHRRHLLAASFLISLQAEKTCSISLVDRDFHITGTIEQDKLFTLGDIGIGTTDPFNHFIPFEYDLEPSAFSLLLKLL